jgi:hypothetical protein
MSTHNADGSIPALNYVEAEYDLDNNRVVALKEASGTLRATHNPRVLGANTEWLPVETRLPEGYNPRFNSLLGQGNLSFTYDPSKHIVVVEFPHADFSVAAVRKTLRDMVNQQANNELRNTDWYIVRKMETGAEIPTEVIEKRKELRDKANEYTSTLDTLPDDKLTSFSVTFGEVPTEAPKAKEEPVAKGGDGREWRTDATAPGQEGKPLHPIEEDE